MTAIYDDERMALYPERLLAFREGRTPPPVQVLVSLADACNHRCGFCTYRDPQSPVSELFLNDGRPPSRLMPDSLVLRLPWELTHAGVRAVQVTGGGEPMLHPLFGHFCRDVLGRGMALSVVTNGTRCKPEWLPTLAQATWIRVSINAGTEEAYRAAHRCGRGEWQKAWDFVAALSVLPPTLGVSMVATEATAPTAARLAGEARVNGARYARITADYHAPQPAWSIVEDQRERLADLIRPYFNVILRPPARMERPKESACYYQAVAPYIGGDGRLYRCCNTAYTEAGVLGDLTTTPLDEAWRRLDIPTFDGRHCPECAFTSKNSAIGRLVAGPAGHALFP
jgi:cyclic pyranopterin phosphate synthase